MHLRKCFIVIVIISAWNSILFTIKKYFFFFNYKKINYHNKVIFFFHMRWRTFFSHRFYKRFSLFLWIIETKGVLWNPLCNYFKHKRNDSYLINAYLNKKWMIYFLDRIKWNLIALSLYTFFFCLFFSTKDNCLKPFVIFTFDYIQQHW